MAVAPVEEVLVVAFPVLVGVEVEAAAVSGVADLAFIDHLLHPDAITVIIGVVEGTMALVVLRQLFLLRQSYLCLASLY